jgi:hypothetical protein
MDLEVLNGFSLFQYEIAVKRSVTVIMNAEAVSARW